MEGVVQLSVARPRLLAKLGRGAMRYVLTLANVPNLALGFTFVEAAKRAAASWRKRSHGGSA